MTREEKAQHVDAMNDYLCGMCESCRGCNGLDCEFARPISINGRFGVILYSTDMDDWIDMAVALDDAVAQVMLVQGQPVAIICESGTVKLGEAKTSDVADFVNTYSEFDEVEWEKSPIYWWDETLDEWAIKL